MKFLLPYQKKIALLLLIVFSFNTLYPTVSWALTSGPAQPEMQGFQASSTSDMVDLFTGDFSYSVPLMDVGGYPLQLSYRSGASIDDEASWVGYGWSLTPGVINRQMRGLPDDFKGEAIIKESYAKPNITKSLTASAMFKLKGKSIIKPSFRVGVRYNNHTGIAAFVGANANLNMGDDASGKLTASLGISADNQSGPLFTGSVNYPIIYDQKDKADKLKGGLDFAFSRNAGLQQMTLGLSFNTKIDLEKPENNKTLSGSISFLDDLGFPQTKPFLRSSSFSFKVSLGAKIFPAFLSPLGITGTYSSSETPKNKITVSTPAYGMLYITESANLPGALKDFNRENDIPFSRKLPNLSVPIHTPDLFNISSSAASGQFKIITSGSGVFADNNQSDNGYSISTGIELGIGTGKHIGFNVPPNFSYTVNSTGKWVNKNNFLAMGDFVDNSLTKPQLLPSIFKKVGEGTINDAAYYSLIGEDQLVRVPLDKSLFSRVYGDNGTRKYLLNQQNRPIANTSLQRSSVEKRGTLFTYLTAREASMFGLNKKILSFPINEMVNCQNQSALITSIDRFSTTPVNTITSPTSHFKFSGLTVNVNPSNSTFNQSFAKPHHLSEITVTETGGSRQVFGIPVYNLTQENVSFSVPDQPEAQAKGFYQYQLGESQVPSGRDDNRVKSKLYNYHYNRQVVPAYATSYLLSAVLSPDYVDRTNDGVTDDDLGTAVKFNYSKLPYTYRWRTPFAPSGLSQDRIANYSEGLLADKKDARATFSYGEREIWYNHSIESKTMVAFFILNDTAVRKDGYGVLGRDGGIDWSRPLRYLKEIRLYSKAEIASKGVNNAVPIKVAHFEYNYELFAGNQPLPNSLQGGKLTLKKIWFSFGRSQKGMLSPFEFSYKLPAPNPDRPVEYLLREYDRWGNYKSFKDNPLQLPNTEYPYSVQNKAIADENAGLWNLNAVKTPTGGKLSVQYESDDYAFVQDKRSTVMAPIKGIGALNKFGQFVNDNKIYVQLENPDNLSNDELKHQYFSGLEYLYFKCYTHLNNSGAKEYVQGYGKIIGVEVINSSTAIVTLEKINQYNPVSMAGWQMLKSSLPNIAYPGYDNLDSEESNFRKVASSLISALARLPELVRSFESIARSKKYCDKIEKDRSWVRINSPGYRKMGGGNRVASLTISDDWKNMTGNPDAPSGEYGQKYYYTTSYTIPTSGRSINISSGVASYEPMIGNEENPFRLPLFYTNKNFLGPSQTSFVERPIGESFFQSPVVGYSKVRVVSVGTSPASEGKMGASETEFFTAKDFPVIVDETPMEKMQPASNVFSRLSIFVITNHVACSQGYLVINNNMHGKIKSEKVTDKNGQQISATFYEYQVKDQQTPTRLDNSVPVLDNSGNVSTRIAGVDVDVYHDMRENRSETIGVSGDPSWGIDMIGTGGNYFNWGWYLPNYEKRLFRSTVSVKSVYQFGILKKVTKIINGSRNESENLLWDAETGEVLLTKTQNEFDQPLYSFNYPAHLMYPGMQGAYFNLGIYLTGLSVNASGAITTHQSVLSPGDELVDLNTGLKYWVTDRNGDGDSPPYQLLDGDGKKQTASLCLSTVKVLRSGKRNMSNTSTGMIVSLENPIRNNQLQISAITKIIDSKSIEFSEDWRKPLTLRPYSKVDNFIEWFHVTQDEDGYGTYWGVLNLKLNKPVTRTTQLTISYNINNVNTSTEVYLSPGQDEIANQNITGNIPPGSLSGAIITTDLNALWPRYMVCQLPTDSLFNPYVTGMLGNWKPKTSHVYDVKRSVPVSNGSSDNISRSGYYTNFSPFWTNNGSNWMRNTGANMNQWRWTQQVSLIGTKGEELENKDALGQYHSAQFGYLQSLPIAVSSNARNREIFVENFEDIGFSLGCKSDSDFCYTSNLPLFSFRRFISNQALEKQNGHTGNASFRLQTPLELTTPTMVNDPAAVYSRTTVGEFKLINNYLLQGFIPIPGKKYILSCWIKDSRKDNQAAMNLYINNSLKTTSLDRWPVVEGWKRIEIEFLIDAAPQLSVLFEPQNGTVLIDDIRIYPFDGQMKSYVYHPSNLRLLAEMDENNFATFYDYDSEGIPIRVRKETEKGIMTLKETRSANKRNQ